MKSLTFISLVALLAQFAPTLAVPNVTVVPLGSTNCASWPGSRGGAPFYIKVDQSEDSGIDGLFTSTRDFNYTGFSGTNVIIDLRKSTRFAKVYYSCSGAGIVKYLFQSNTPITVAKDFRNAYPTFGSAGYKLEPYAHEIDGVRQPGVFLGARNLTTWGFNYVRETTCGQIDYYSAKLQGLPIDPDTETRATYDPEFFGFLKAEQV
ncbi:hypothetical protein B0H63DRAFT_471320 [Podospora didyma]|uniref:Uncharacterized protein n=1 Tax=Podospora didyma TaxID=330526 RepID=A0AAE0U214_9PEZI|nr:hypothetical protein B0H63DRAFT_471320 [Podospora didyma]